MSRLDVNPLGSLPSIELVMPAIRATGSRKGQTDSFDQYLEHASQTMDLASAGHSDARPNGPGRADRPSPPDLADPKPNEQSSPEAEANDDPAQGTSPNSTDPNQSTAAETQSQDDSQAAGSDAESHANEEDDEQELQLAGDAAVVLVEVVDVEAPSMPTGAEEVHLGDFLPEENFAGQPQAANLAEAQSVATSELPTGGLEETDQPEVKTTTPEYPTAVPEADGETAVWADQQNTTGQRVAGEPDESAEPVTRRADGSPDVNGSAHSEPLDPSAQSERLALDSPRDNEPHAESRSVVERAGDGQLVEQVNDAAPWPSAPGQGDGQTAPPAQPLPSQGMQQTSSGQDQGASGAGQVDRVRFVQRVAGAFQAAGGSGESVRLRLYPPELGSLHLEVSVKGGSMTARLEVETNAARTMLLDNLPALRDRLAEQDIKVARFDVDLADQSADGAPRQPAHNPQSHDHPQQGAPNSRSDYDPEPEAPSAPAWASPLGEGSRLDVII